MDCFILTWQHNNSKESHEDEPQLICFVNRSTLSHPDVINNWTKQETIMCSYEKQYDWSYLIIKLDCIFFGSLQKTCIIYLQHYRPTVCIVLISSFISPINWFWNNISGEKTKTLCPVSFILFQNQNLFPLQSIFYSSFMHHFWSLEHWFFIFNIRLLRIISCDTSSWKMQWNFITHEKSRNSKRNIIENGILVLVKMI